MVFSVRFRFPDIWPKIFNLSNLCWTDDLSKPHADISGNIFPIECGFPYPACVTYSFYIGMCVYFMLH